MRTIFGHPNVGDKLVRGISEPHGFDISCDDVGRLIVILDVEVLDGG